MTVKTAIARIPLSASIEPLIFVEIEFDTSFGRTYLSACPGSRSELPAVLFVPDRTDLLWARESGRLRMLAEHFRILVLDVAAQPDLREGKALQTGSDEYFAWLSEICSLIGFESGSLVRAYGSLLFLLFP